MTFYLTPYRRLSSLRQAMDRLFDETLHENMTEREMALAIDVKGSDDDYQIRAFVPGLEAEDLNIEILNNTITIRGEFKDTQKDDKNLVCELPSGAFSRVITLPTDLDPSKADASIKNGILLLTVPKAEAHRPKSIKVNVA